MSTPSAPTPTPPPSANPWGRPTAPVPDPQQSNVHGRRFDPRGNLKLLAGELNLSETTFVLPPDSPEHAARVRIFTRTSEFDFAGHPHSTQLRTTERYTRPKFGELEVVTTIEDPGAYAKPFTVKFTHTLRPGWDLMEYICNENNQDVEHIRGPAGL